MSLLSDRVLRYLVWVLFALVIVVLVVAIFIPVKSLVDPDLTASPKRNPVRSENPVKPSFKRYQFVPIDQQAILGEV